MNRKFEKEVLRLAPEFRVLDHYFYEPPVEHILAGFAWEKPPSGIYIWKYALPLYEGKGLLHLTYGSRLPPSCGRIVPTHGQERATAEEFVRRIGPYRAEVARLRSLRAFLEYVKELPLDNPVVRVSYAMTLIMLDRDEEAMAQLLLCTQLPWHDVKSDVQSLMAELQDGSARQRLLESEKCFRQRLGL